MSELDQVDPMPEDEFWKLIGKVKTRMLLEDPDEALEPLVAALAKRDVADIQAFEERLARVLYDLDGEERMRASGENGDSPDCFLYVRCYVVASGRDTYRKVLHDLNAIPKSLETWCEELLSVSSQAWASKTGGDEGDVLFDTSVSYETGSNKANWRS